MHPFFFLYSFLCLDALVAVSAQSTSGPSTGSVIGSKYPVFNLTQQVDHGNDSTATFNQRYQIITDYFKPGGPILLAQCAESVLVPIENGNFFDMAQELGGIVATLEHRFFGTSMPEPMNNSLSFYEPLTLDNVIDDAVSFVDFIKKNVTGAADSKALVTGGSYGGNLALAFRVKRPDTFFGSFASGPMTESFGPLANNTAKFLSSEYLSNVYFDESALAAQKIQAAMAEFYACALIGKNCTAELIPQMNLCNTGSTPNDTEIAIMYAGALANYRYIPQFNYPVSSAFKMPYPFQFLINETLAASTPGQVVSIPLAMLNWQSPSDCLQWTSPNITGELSIPVSESWFYLQCQYYPISENAVPAGNLLPPADVSSRVEVCAYPQFQSSIYNETNEFYQKYLGTDTETLDNTTRLIILQSGYDRVSGVGMPDLTLSDDRQHSRVVFTSGTGHTEDTLSEEVVPRGLRPQLDAVRDMKVEYAREWLGMYNPKNLWNTTTALPPQSTASSPSSTPSPGSSSSGHRVSGQLFPLAAILLLAFIW